MSEPLRILMMVPVPEERLAQIRAICPEAEVMDAGTAFGALMRQRTQPQPGDDEVLARLAEQLAEAEVICTGFLPPPGLPESGPKVKWLHTMAAGVDRMQGTPIMRSAIQITNARGSNAPSVAEYALWMMLDLAKQGRRLADSQRQHVWDGDARPALLDRKTLGIIGYGAIGRAIAERARPFGMRILGVRRHPGLQPGDDGLVDAVYGLDDLHRVLGESDYVVLAMPLTPETRGMIGPAELAAMKPSGRLVNIARGAVIQEAALIDALRNGTIAAAALDVFDTEPLPADSPFWNLPNVLITPHRAGLSDDNAERVMDLFLQNLAAYRAGRPLLTPVNKDLGY